MLIAKQIEQAKPREKGYRMADMGGLFLFITPTGAKVWRMRYRFDGKEQTLSIGEYPDISLSKARSTQAATKLKIKAGINPAQQKREENQPVKCGDSFEEVYREWLERRKKVWSAGYALELQRMFDQDILPMIGSIPIAEIEPSTLLNVIRVFENRGAMERANKARRRCGEVFRYGVITGRTKYNPAPDLAGALTGYQKKNYPFLPQNQIGAFNQALAKYSGSIISLAATQIIQYTAMRTIEARELRWTWVNFELWEISIPPEIMKMRRLHAVPISNQVYALLKKLQPVTGDYDYIFPGRNDRTKPISENAVLMVIRQIGYDGIASGHGFRHQFSTAAHEHGWLPDAIERQLAHTSSTIRGVYNHAQYWDTRVKMMQWYADYLDGL